MKHDYAYLDRPCVRPVLISSAHLRVALAVLTIYCFATTTYFTKRKYDIEDEPVIEIVTHEGVYCMSTTWLVVTIVPHFIDLVFSGIFLCGLHLENYKLLDFFSVYNAVTVVLGTVMVFLMIVDMPDYYVFTRMTYQFPWIIVGGTDLYVALGTLVSLVHYILMFFLRAEIRWLRGPTEEEEVEDVKAEI